MSSMFDSNFELDLDSDPEWDAQFGSEEEEMALMNLLGISSGDFEEEMQGEINTPDKVPAPPAQEQIQQAQQSELPPVSPEPHSMTPEPSSEPPSDPPIQEQIQQPRAPHSVASNQEFDDLSNEDVLKFISNEENKNTLKKTMLDIQKFERFLQSKKGEQRPFHTIPPDELDTYVANFILSAKKTDGSEYEPSSIRNIISSLDRKLKRMKYHYSIMTEKGPAFQLSRDAMKAKQKSLKKKGKGNKAQASKALTDQEINILYEKDILGDSSPAALINTLWLNNTMHFGLRGTKENRDLQWGDVSLNADSSGHEYLEFAERQTKTRTGENICDTRKVAPRMYANSDNLDRDPISFYKLYASKRPVGFSKPEDPFYIAPRTVPLSSSASHGQWFIKLPLGQKKLGSLMKTMAQKGNLDSSKRLTNHSARKTLVQKLRNAGVPPTSIKQISGHKSLESVLNYSEMAEAELMACSKILSSSSNSNLSCPSASVAPVMPVCSPSSVTPAMPAQPCQTQTEPATATSVCLTEAGSEKTDNFPKAMFAGATLNIQNLHVHTH